MFIANPTFFVNKLQLTTTKIWRLLSLDHD